MPNKKGTARRRNGCESHSSTRYVESLGVEDRVCVRRGGGGVGGGPRGGGAVGGTHPPGDPELLGTAHSGKIHKNACVAAGVALREDMGLQGGGCIERGGTA